MSSKQLRTLTKATESARGPLPISTGDKGTVWPLLSRSSGRRPAQVQGPWTDSYRQRCSSASGKLPGRSPWLKDDGKQYCVQSKQLALPLLFWAIFCCCHGVSQRGRDSKAQVCLFRGFRGREVRGHPLRPHVADTTAAASHSETESLSSCTTLVHVLP